MFRDICVNVFFHFRYEFNMFLLFSLHSTTRHPLFNCSHGWNAIFCKIIHSHNGTIINCADHLIARKNEGMCGEHRVWQNLKLELYRWQASEAFLGKCFLSKQPALNWIKDIMYLFVAGKSLEGNVEILCCGRKLIER